MLKRSLSIVHSMANSDTGPQGTFGAAMVATLAGLRARPGNCATAGEIGQTEQTGEAGASLPEDTSCLMQALPPQTDGASHPSPRDGKLSQDRECRSIPQCPVNRHPDV